jgi:mycothiol synthase
VSLEVRGARLEEVPAIRALIEEHAQAAFGETELSEEEVRSWFGLPRLWIQVAERDGELVGYVDVRNEGGSRFNVDARTLHAEVASVLAEAAAEHARSEAEAESPVLHGFVQGDDPVLREAFEAAGWQPIRHSFQMGIDLADEVPEPSWPEGFTLRNLHVGEEQRLHEANMDAFADHWDFRWQPFEEWRRYTVDHHGFDPTLYWLVEDGDEIAGFSVNSWHFSGDPQFGWIGILGVRKLWRKRGLGTALLQHSFRDFRRRGATRVGLGVDGENTTGAVRLYERAGMRVVRRNDIYEKKLP